MMAPASTPSQVASPDAVEQAGARSRSSRPGRRRPPSRSNKAARRSGIEMGGDLVEEEDRAAAGALGDEIGMGEDQADQQRLLLAGRAERGGLVLADDG